MDVQTVSIGDIRPYHRNPREHTSESISELQAAIRKFGFRIPVVLDEENTIVTGHGRFKAVQQLEGELDDRIESLRDVGRDDFADNLETINDGKLFAIFEEELDGRTVDEFRISDNKITEMSSWDRQLLQSEIEEIGANQIVGYDEEDLDDLLPDYEAELEEPGGDDDEDDDPFGDEVGHVEEDDRVVELVCPECLEQVDVDAELALREFEVLSE